MVKSKSADEHLSRKIFGLPGQDSNVVNEAIHQVSILVWLAVHGSLALVDERLWVELDFKLMFFFRALVCWRQQTFSFDSVMTTHMWPHGGDLSQIDLVVAVVVAQTVFVPVWLL
jgi:hypothetical protein